MNNVEKLKRTIKLREKDIFNLVMRWDKYEGENTRTKWLKRFNINQAKPKWAL